jgi:hypothetical protein
MEMGCFWGAEVKNHCHARGSLQRLPAALLVTPYRSMFGCVVSANRSGRATHGVGSSLIENLPPDRRSDIVGGHGLGPTRTLGHGGWPAFLVSHPIKDRLLAGVSLGTGGELDRPVRRRSRRHDAGAVVMTPCRRRRPCGREGPDG